MKWLGFALIIFLSLPSRAQFDEPVSDRSKTEGQYLDAHAQTEADRWKILPQAPELKLNLDLLNAKYSFKDLPAEDRAAIIASASRSEMENWSEHKRRMLEDALNKSKKSGGLFDAQYNPGGIREKVESVTGGWTVKGNVGKKKIQIQYRTKF